MEDYASLSYRDLQKLCKTHGLMCKGKTEELRARLMAHVAPQAGTQAEIDEGEGQQEQRQQQQQQQKSNEENEKVEEAMDVALEDAGQKDEEIAAAPFEAAIATAGQDMFSDMPDLVAQPTAAAAAAAVAQQQQEKQEAEEGEGSRTTVRHVTKRKADASIPTTNNSSGSISTTAETLPTNKVPKPMSMIRKPSPASVFAARAAAAMQTSAGGAGGGGGGAAARATTAAVAPPTTATKKATTTTTTSSSSTSNKKVK